MTYSSGSWLLMWCVRGKFKSSAIAGGIFKAWPRLASLSPEGPPASDAGPVQGRCELLLSSGGHREKADHKHHHVQDGEGHLEAGS